MRVPFSRQIALGYLLIVVIAVVASVWLLRDVDQLRDARTDVVDEHLAAARASDQLISGVNQSLAALRGLMLSRQDTAAAEAYEQSRAEAWSRIDRAASQLRLLAPRHDDPVVLANVADLLPAIDEMRRMQHNVERILRSGEDVPAAELLLTNVLPRGDKMLALLSNITEHTPVAADAADMIESAAAATAADGAVDKPAGSPGTEVTLTGELLNRLKANHAISLAALQRFVTDGAPELEAQFQLHRRTFDAALTQSDAITANFTPYQHMQWEQFMAMNEAYAPLAMQVIELRSRPDWNVAMHLQNKIITPLHERIELAAATIEAQHTSRLPNESAQFQTATASIERSLLTMLIAIAVLGIALGAWQSHQVRTNINALLRRLQMVRPDAAEHLAPAALRYDLSQLVSMLDVVAFGDGDAPVSAAAASPRIEMETTAIADTAAAGLHDMQQIAEHYTQISRLNDTLAIITEQTHLIAEYLASESQRLGEDGASLNVLSEELDKLSGLLLAANEQIASDLEQIGQAAHSVGERLNAIATMSDDIRTKMDHAAVQIVVVDNVADKVRPPKRDKSKASAKQTAAA